MTIQNLSSLEETIQGFFGCEIDVFANRKKNENNNEKYLLKLFLKEDGQEGPTSLFIFYRMVGFCSCLQTEKK